MITGVVNLRKPTQIYYSLGLYHSLSFSCLKPHRVSLDSRPTLVFFQLFKNIQNSFSTLKYNMYE